MGEEVKSETVNTKKKKGGTLKKFFVSIISGALFGTVACASFYGATYFARQQGWIEDDRNKMVIEKSKLIEEQPEVPEISPTEIAHTDIADTELGQTNLITSNSTFVTTDVTGVVENVMPSIVSITNNFTYSYYYYQDEATSKGSGIIIGANDSELLIVTNYHVIENNDTIEVTFCDDTTATAVVKGSDADMDLAVLAVNYDDIDSSTQSVIKIATMGNSDNLKVGEAVIAIGNALGYGQSVTTGVVSALDREMDMNNDGNTASFIQTDAAINGGNSGGALLNLAGEVIGINSNKIGGTAVEGMGYAIPISSAKPIIEELMVKETRSKIDPEDQGYFGITGASITAAESAYYGYPEGVYIVSVVDGSAADKCGIEKGDLICSFDGESISSMEQLQRVLQYYKAGETMEVGVYKYSKKTDSYEKVILEITLDSQDIFDED